MVNKNLIKTLVKNYEFKPVKIKKLPSIDFVYPDYVEDGNIEDFRFSPGLRDELREREYIVKEGLENKAIAWSSKDDVIKEIDLIAPRLGIDDLVFRNLHSTGCKKMIKTTSIYILMLKTF